MYWSGSGGVDSGNMGVGAEDIAVTITGRTPGLTYNITIVALSDHLPSPTVGAVMVTLGEPHAGKYCFAYPYVHLLSIHYAGSTLLKYFCPVKHCFVFMDNRVVCMVVHYHCTCIIGEDGFTGEIAWPKT